MGRRAIAGVLALAALGLFFLPARLGASSSVEYELLRLVNGGRSAVMPMHSGLQVAARGHSREMGRAGRLSHAGAAQRIKSAAPAPAEANGAPDDGYTGTFCENIAYVGGVPEGDVADRVYQGWRRSASHTRCMTNPKMTAAGVGLYFDGSRWWATLELMQDTTPPASQETVEPAPLPEAPRPVEVAPEVVTTDPARPAPTRQLLPTKTPAPATPAPPDDPAPTARPITEARQPEVLEPEPAAGRSELGWPEILAGIGIACVSIFAYRRTGALRETDT